ncbi:MAG: 6-carboxytetrahydropterin synthase [Candidatus Thiodiazotropha sp. (ex Dulcina madagascariensis)]|nr:6-carboxytetrahydropterin synthase [Candidatus Thiodiazotropha sp. (ex Epidulcina cf. delphinae)]MCU7921762.1 6-carboxytetrahydropterin synthase [Candidatus Thiodiazotropha sp. (ex Dulcina madagascariensis)]MCU7925944.1 6-carboxytetrahydropterin synthase [Candidatus Thiodiazotropha sp. (ex Dulcina madagascariensis)]MCU7935210.1 6-carboxytetrahydropterin synthase [Candidatus Thiodiazotropha sp. (ex Dulcina madagascariensis)]
MYTVIKEIHFCYGHRLLNHQGKCRHLHGHNAKAVIRLESDQLDPLGMVCDFSDIGDYVKDWIDQTLDHCMLLHADDPVLPLLREAGEPVYVMQNNPTAENIARLIFERVETGGFPVVEVSIHETDSALASYRRG